MEAARRRAALEIHLEDARERQARGDLAAERGKALVVREAQVRAVAGKGGESADLAADEPIQHLAAGRGEAVERPDGVVAPGHVFLERELAGELLHQRIGARLAAAREDAGLAFAAEELAAHAQELP